MLLGETHVRTNVEVRLDVRALEQRNRPVHGNHRDMGERLNRKLPGRNAGGNNEHRTGFGVATLIEITGVTQS
ncbi:hypothetical protein D3C76_1831760 [compost metagenome]